MSGTRTDYVQVLYTTEPNKPPPPNMLTVGELGAEVASPMKLWIGVPPDLDPSGRKLLYDSSAVGGSGEFVPVAGGNMTGPLYLSSDPSTDSQAANKHYVDNMIVDGGNF